MPKHATLGAELRNILAAITAGGPAHAHLHRIVRISNSIALTLVQARIASGTLDVRRFGLSPADIAFDAIADLFRQDQDGKLLQITTYFEGVGWESLENEELLIHLRRLVFSRTNQGLFRMFQEIDPGLGKILRNTKLAIAALGSFEELDFFGEPCIAPNLCDPLERLSMVDRDCLERRLLEMTNGSERIPEILARLSRYLRDQNEHSRMVPVMWVAYAIRAVYARVEVQEQQPPFIEEQLAEEEARAILLEACKHVKTQNEKQHISAKGLSREVYATYFEVIARILVKRLISNDGHDVSLFKLLKASLPDLTREEYNTTHKARLEYLARLTEQKAVEMLKRSLL